MDLVSAAREIVGLFERNDVKGVDRWRGDHEGPGNWSLGNWLRDAWFPYMADNVGTERRLGRTWVVRDHLVRVTFEGERGRAFASVRFDADGLLNGLALSLCEKEEGGPPAGIYITCPDDRWTELKDFYGRLVHFGLAWDGDSEYRAPRWPDPQYPQQIHLDILVADLEASEEVALTGGASPLRKAADHHVYADPIGHPLCLYQDEAGGRSGEPGVLGRIVLDCPEPAALATFYGSLLHLRERVQDSADLVVIARDRGTYPMLGFQRVADHRPPVWHDPSRPQQMHFDLLFDDRAAAVRLAVELGATHLPPPGFPHAYADPAGHAFCLLEAGD